MEEQVKAGQPFYLQISHYAMHEGRECLPATREKYARHPLVQAWYQKMGTTAEKVKRKEDPAIWLGMGEDLDGRIGAVLDQIKALGIEDNTYVVLVSDNGYRHKELRLTPGLTQPLHAHKWWLWEGGIRVPMIVRGPGIKPGSQFTGNVVNYDFLPTFVEWAGGDPKAIKNIDGVSLAGYMARQGAGRRVPQPQPLLPLPALPEQRAALGDDLRLVEGGPLLRAAGPADAVRPVEGHGRGGEHRDRSKPDTHRKLHGEMMAYLKQVGARFPKVNPGYDAEAYKKPEGLRRARKVGPVRRETSAGGR